jgi:hypothetical protein
VSAASATPGAARVVKAIATGVISELWLPVDAAAAGRILLALTGAATLAAGALLYGTGTSQPATLAAGAANRVLQANGAAAPSWVSALTLTGLTVSGSIYATSPAAAVEVIGQVGSPSYLRFNQTANGGKLWRLGSTGAVSYTSFDIYNQTDNALCLSCRSDGSTVLGTDPGGSELLRVGGSIRASGTLTATGTNVSLGQSANSQSYCTITGASGGSAAGSAFVVYNSATQIIAIANKSSILGGAYDATPLLYAASAIAVTNGLILGTDPGGSDIFRAGGAGTFGGKIKANAAAASSTLTGNTTAQVITWLQSVFQ